MAAIDAFYFKVSCIYIINSQRKIKINPLNTSGTSNVCLLAKFADSLLFVVLLYIQSFKTIEFWEIAVSIRSTLVNSVVKNDFFLLNSAICKPFYNQSVNSKAFKYTIIILKSKIYFS